MKTKSSSKTIQKDQAATAVPGEPKRIRLGLQTEIRDGDYIGVAQVLAQSKTAVGNWLFPGARAAFPNDPKMRTVAKYYPYALGGPLLVDYPHTTQEIVQCEAKAEVLHKLGYRYLIVTKGISLQQAAEQLDKK